LHFVHIIQGERKTAKIMPVFLTMRYNKTNRHWH